MTREVSLYGFEIGLSDSSISRERMKRNHLLEPESDIRGGISKVNHITHRFEVGELAL